MPLNRDHLWTEGRENVVVSGSFAPDTANAPTDVRGVGFSVARTSTGLFTITFDSKYYQVNSATAALQLATGDDKVAQIGAYTAPTATASGTLQIRVWDISGAAVADVAANANNRVNFSVTFQKMDVT